MRYEIIFRPSAVADLDRLSPEVARRITKKIEAMRDGLAGDVRRLVDYPPGWRLRIGDWRVLFERQAQSLVIYRVVHRSRAYD